MPNCCGLLGTQNQDSFFCKTCGLFHINAAWAATRDGPVPRTRGDEPEKEE